MSGALDHSPADIVRQLMIDLAAATDPEDGQAWPLYVGTEPATPDNCLTLYNTTGRIQGRTQFDGEMQEHHGIQLRVRAQTEKVGYAKARAMAVVFDGSVLRAMVTIDSSVYQVQSITRTSDVLPLGKDGSSERQVFTVNGLVAVRKTN